MNVHRISRFGVVNAYLVDESDGLTLIDTLIPKSGQKLIGAAAQTGKPIVRIVLTHAHGDHVGSLDELHCSLPEAEVSISTRDARPLAGDMRLDADEPQAKLRGGYPAVETKPDRTFEPGERIGSLEVIAAPGHTPGQVALLDSRDGSLYCGDAYSTLGGMATTARPHLLFPLPGLSTWHPPTTVETARTLRALDPARLAPGHGRVFEGPAPQMDRALAKVRRVRS